MARLVCMLRVKDGILFVQDWLSNMEKLVDEIVVVDNGSTDGTYEKLRAHPKVVDIARTEGFDEGRDKVMVYEMARKRNPDWCLWLDVDEIFEDKMTRDVIEKMMKSKIFTKYYFRRLHFHKDYHHVEASFKSLLSISRPDRILWKEQPTGYFKNIKIHNGLIQGISGPRCVSTIRIKHYGAVDINYLERKTNLYVAVDPQRKDLYVNNFMQSLPVWKWYEYNEKPFLVSMQNVLFSILYIISIIKTKLS